MEKDIQTERHVDKQERGQSIVILAASMIVLLAFIGMAVDLGLIWVRDAQLTAAVDSAALAGAPELSNTGLTGADEKAVQFLHTNKIPLDTISTFGSGSSQTLLGAQEYTISVTWTIDLFFLRVLGFRTVDLTKSATAAYFPLVDIYASTRVEDGALTASNQSIFGPNICTGYGDPFSPLNSPWEPGLYSYRYRILIPDDYEDQAGTSIVRVEIFDPDSVNQANATDTIIHTQRWVNELGGPLTEQIIVEDQPRCSLQKNACIINTCEWDEQNSDYCNGGDADERGLPASTFDDEQAINPFWFVRIDENRGAGSAPGSGGCGSPDSYDSDFNTATEFRLYYFEQRADGTLVPRELAKYTGQTDSNRDADSFSHGTDLNWASPGASNSFGVVPTDCGSITGGSLRSSSDTRCNPLTAFDTVAGPGEGFEIDINSDMANTVVDQSTGARYIYLDITSLSGATENGFELWAGPPDESSALPTNGNARNVWIADNPGARDSAGVVAYAMGVLPMNSNATEDVEIPLIYVPPDYAGRTISVSLFDTDNGTEPPVTFYFDTISRLDYEVTYGVGVDPDGRCFAGDDPDCNNTWVGPPGTDAPAFYVAVPTLTDACTDPSDPDQAAICNPFYGGNMWVDYQGGRQDTYVWLITLPSLPYLVR